MRAALIVAHHVLAERLNLHSRRLQVFNSPVVIFLVAGKFHDHQPLLARRNGSLKDIEIEREIPDQRLDYRLIDGLLWKMQYYFL